MTEDNQSGDWYGVDAIADRVRTRLRLRRELLGMKQQLLGTLLPDPPKQWFIGRIELGEIRLPTARLLQISRLLRVPVPWLLGIDGFEELADDDPYLDFHTAAKQILGAQYDHIADAFPDKGDELDVVLQAVIEKRIVNEGVEYDGGTYITRIQSQASSVS